MADEKDQKRKDSLPRKEVEKLRKDIDPKKTVPYGNRQLTPGRDGQTLTR